MPFDKIEDENLEFGDIVAFEVAERIRENINLLSLVVPIGEIVPIMVNIPGVPTPDPNIWQECDGSEIVNPNSPLRTVGDQQNFVPDMRERYVRVPQIFGLSGVASGLNDTFIFRHDHAGVTGTFTSPEDVDPSNDISTAAPVHAHTIDFSFDFPMNVEPPFYTMKWFMRIQ